MKRFVFSIVIIFLFVSVITVYAQYDLSGFSYNDLQTIVAQAQREMMTRPEFQSVTVPVGVYQVGKEIPAGNWTVTITDGDWMAEVETGASLKEDKNGVDMWGKGYNSAMLSESNPSRTVNFVDGYYVEISMGPVIFSTPTGVSFSFK